MYVGDARRHAGHAHWQNIAKTKSANDQIKGRVIGKLATRIVNAIRCMYFIQRLSCKAKKNLMMFNYSIEIASYLEYKKLLETTKCYL